MKKLHCAKWYKSYNWGCIEWARDAKKLFREQYKPYKGTDNLVWAFVDGYLDAYL